MASPRDYKNTIIPNWCPGCGDYGIQNAISAVCAKKGWANEDITLISGIGCSSRIGGYQYCYGAHTTHGRALPFAQGIKCANKDTHMIVCSGDGDSYAIGLGHAMHAMKRNMDITYLVFDNQVYGLTKGQYSPTSPRGFVSKSSPYGTVEDPFRPAELCFGARGHFFARAVANDAAHTVDILKAAYHHKGASVCEILQNCMIFNNGAYDPIYTREGRSKNAIYVEHGKPLVFGENQEYGLMQDGFALKVVKIGENGITLDDILVHDAHAEDNTLQLKLAMMDNEHGFPVALGVIRDVEAPTYNDAVNAQIEEIKGKKPYHTFEELLDTQDTWEVK